MNIAEILRAHARTRPGDVAIIDTGRGRSRFIKHQRVNDARFREITFAGLDEASACAAGMLWQQGLRPGDAVLVFHPMSIDLYVALLALFRLRLIAMFLDPSAGREHIERCIALHRPNALIASTRAHLLRILSPALRQIPMKFSIGYWVPGALRWQRLERMPLHEEIVPCELDTPALLTFTSGSTGQPKAAVRTHGLLLAQHRALKHSLELTPADVDLATMPIILLANLASGVTSIIPDADLRSPGAIKGKPVLNQIERHEVISSTASPAFFECLVQAAQTGEQLTGVRKLYTGGAPVFPRMLDQMQRLAPQSNVVAVYGSTEAEPISHVALREITAEDHKAMIAGKGLLAGPPVEEIRLRILRHQWGTPVGPYTEDDFAAACMPAEEPGEIVVSGEHVLPGYLNGQGDEETKFRVDGAIWHRTGDAGYLDREGRVWLLGRCSARIQDDHGTLYPFAAEVAVSQDARVRRSAMVTHAGRRILAVEFYDPHKSLNAAALKQLLSWTHVDEVRVCAKIPVDKRHNAKIDYPALHRILDQSG